MTTGAIPVNLPRVSPNSTPGATPASTPINPDPHVTRDANAAARAITATDKADNPVNDRTRERDTKSRNSEERLSQSEQQALARLQARDRAVRAHEQAHLAAAGSLARGGADYTYQEGPDGKRYAVGGEVDISVSEGRTPEETIRKAQQIRSAALAPANPSAQDRAVAAEASRIEAEARAEQAAADNRERRQQVSEQGRASQAFIDTENNLVDDEPVIDTFA